MRVRVDRDLCQGHGVCVSEAPEVFALDDALGPVRLLQDEPPEAQRAPVEQAVRYCPTHALALEDD